MNTETTELLASLQQRLTAAEEENERITDELARCDIDLFEAGIPRSTGNEEDGTFRHSSLSERVAAAITRAEKAEAEAERERLREILIETDDVLSDEAEEAEAAFNGAAGTMKNCRARVNEWKARRDKALNRKEGK